jgi:hypothetical protein
MHDYYFFDYCDRLGHIRGHGALDWQFQEEQARFVIPPSLIFC